MDKTFREYMYTCPHCKGRLNDWLIGNYRGRYFNKKLNTFRARYFCTEECYKDYVKNFIVEMYKGKPIYCVEINGEKRYIPYFEASYYFINVDDCKKRMDMESVGVVGPYNIR